MGGQKNFNTLRRQVEADPRRRERVKQIERTYDVLLALADLREQFGVTQQMLAQILDVSQPNISKIEQQSHDIMLSTVAAYIEALGGHLELRAVFPDHAWRLNLPMTDPYKDRAEA